MFEKVNPSHPDKVADRIAGALVDIAYSLEDDPRIAVEVLIGHGYCSIVAETSVELPLEEIDAAVCRIAGSDLEVTYLEVPQDEHLAENQECEIRCGDNGIFRGAPVKKEQQKLSEIARAIYEKFPYDGKYIIDGNRLVICQSNASECDIYREIEYRGCPLAHCFRDIKVNPLGYWTGGTDVDTGATNRKLGSDMTDGITGGGLHGKDLSKADVSVNIYAHLLAQRIEVPVDFSCAIGDEMIRYTPYSEIVETAREYVKSIGGFEKLAEWGLV